MVTSTNYTDLSYVEETVAGTTPTSPVFNIIPTTDGTPEGNITTTVSETIRSDRQTDDLVPVDADVGGPFNYEISYSPFKPLIKSLLQSAAAAGSVDSSSSDLTFGNPAAGVQPLDDNAGGAFTGVVAGQYIAVGGASYPANNGVFLVKTVTDNSTISIVNAAGISSANDSGVTFKGESWRNGADTPDSYTFCKRVLGTDVPAFFYYKGCQISQMSFNFETGSILTGAGELVGLQEDVTETPYFGQTFDNPPAYDLMNSVSSVVNVAIGGLAETTKFSSLDLTITNNISSAKRIGVLGAAGLASFALDITGSISIYFEDIAAYTKFKNSESFDIAFTLQDVSGNIMVISMPKAKFESLATPIAGKDNFLMMEGSVRALRNTDTDHMIQFTFIDA